MHAQFEVAQHKLLNHALACLLRFGERLSITFLARTEKEHVVRISTISASESAFCAFYFVETFFQAYSLNGERRRVDIKMPIRNLQVVLRGQLNKRLQLCEWDLNEDGPESRLVVRLHSIHGAIRTHKLTYESEPAQCPRDKQGYMNRVVADVGTIAVLLDNFVSKGNGEVTMVCSSDSMSLQTKEDDYVGDIKQRNTLQTMVKVHRSHFATYDIKSPTALTFSLREFRAPISLADHLQYPLEFRFDITGEPLSLHIQGHEMYGHVLLATSAPDEDRLREMAEQGTERPANEREVHPNAAPHHSHPVNAAHGALDMTENWALSDPSHIPAAPTTSTPIASSNDAEGQLKDVRLGSSLTEGGTGNRDRVDQDLFRSMSDDSDRDGDSFAHEDSGDEVPRTQAEEQRKRARYNPLF